MDLARTGRWRPSLKVWLAAAIGIDVVVFCILHFWLWRVLPLAAVSIGAALLALEVVFLVPRDDRQRLWLWPWLSLSAALVLQIDWAPVAKTSFEAMGFELQAQCMKCLTDPPDPAVASGKGGFDCRRMKPTDLSTAPDPAVHPEKAALDEGAREFLKIQYGTAIGEIQKRLDSEQVLFGLKFTLIGAIMVALFGLIRRDLLAGEKTPGRDKAPDQEKAPARETALPSIKALKESPIAAAFFWASVVVAAIIDARIQFNAAFIATLGTWIRTVEMTLLDPASQLGWEHFLTKHGLLGKASYPFVRMSWGLVTWLLFAVTVVILHPTTAGGDPGGSDTRKINRAFSLFAFGAFALSSLGFRPGSGDVIVHALVWAGLGGAAVYLAFEEPTGQGSAGDQRDEPTPR